MNHMRHALISKWAIVTKVRPNADGSLTTSSEAVSTLAPHWIYDTDPMDR